MSSLQDICLTTIEESGTDTRDLKDLNVDLPKRMWSRHPILLIKNRKWIQCVDPETKKPIHPTIDYNLFLWFTIRVEYTGVFRITYEKSFHHDVLESEKGFYLSYLKDHYPFWVPATSIETYEGYRRDPTPEQEAKIRRDVEENSYWSMPEKLGQAYRNYKKGLTAGPEDPCWAKLLEESFEVEREDKTKMFLAKRIFKLINRRIDSTTIELVNGLTEKTMVTIGDYQGRQSKEDAYPDGPNYEILRRIQEGIELLPQVIHG